jgi:hypothetical protein
MFIIKAVSRDNCGRGKYFRMQLGWVVGVG